MSTPFKRVSGRNSFPSMTQHRRVELRPVGADGSAVATYSLQTGPARVTHIAVDYQNQPATTDLLIKSASAGAGGTTLLTLTNTNTDIAISGVATPGAVDEGRAATAATDGVDGGWFVADGLYFDLAQGDGQTTGDEAVVIDLWYIEMDLLEIALFPAGADGSAADSRLVKTSKAGIIQGLSIDFGAGVPATTDVVIKCDVIDALTGGTTLFTSTNSATDLGSANAGVPLGIIAIDEANGAAAATDGIGGGQPFRKNVYVTVAQADGYAADENITVRLWCSR